jgi:hypothetical protein
MGSAELYGTISVTKGKGETTMKVRDFEERVWEIEQVRIVVHAANAVDVEIYDYKNAAPEGWQISELSKKRIDKCIGKRTFTVVQGDGEEPHGRTVLRTIRKSYG